MATNEVTSLRNAIVTLLEADSAMQALAGRSTGIVLLWGSIAADQFPVMALLLPSNVRLGGSGHRRRVAVLLGAYASGNGAQDKVEAMTRRAREVLKTAAFATQSLTATVMEAVERGADPLAENDDQIPDQEARHDLDLIIELTAPAQ